MFRDDSLFQPRSFKDESECKGIIGSPLVSALVSGLGDVTVSNLTSPIIVELSVKPV